MAGERGMDARCHKVEIRKSQYVSMRIRCDACEENSGERSRR